MALQHPTAPPGPAPKTHGRDDGERVYVGTSHVEVSLPHRPKVQRTQTNLEVISTRTRKHHFTIDFGDHCVLPLHRPEGEKRHVYDLDALTRCEMPQGQLSITTARLTLDTEHDALAMVFDGSMSVRGMKGATVSGKVHMTLDAKRR